MSTPWKLSLTPPWSRWRLNEHALSCVTSVRAFMCAPCPQSSCLLVRLLAASTCIWRVFCCQSLASHSRCLVLSILSRHLLILSGYTACILLHKASYTKTDESCIDVTNGNLLSSMHDHGQTKVRAMVKIQLNLPPPTQKKLWSYVKSIEAWVLCEVCVVL